MLPIFKSHYSIGKSILTLSDPNDDESGPDSIIKLCLDNNIKDLVLVEDAPTGFFKAQNQCKKFDLNLIFGLRLKVSSFKGENKSEDDSIHKCIVFAKTSEGVKLLNKIYSSFFCDHNGVGNYEVLKLFWSDKDLLLSIPFYDSFLYYNSFYFSNCLPDFSFCAPVFFIEDNNLPEDAILSLKVQDYCLENGFNFQKAKSIFYKDKKDVEAFQTYKCICSRTFGRKKTLSNPGLDGFGSSDFCLESLINYRNEKAV